MGNKVLMLAFVWAALCAGNPLMAQTKTKKKSAAQLSKQYVKYAKDKVKGKEQLAQKRSSDPATVTRDSAEQETPKTFEDVYNEFRRRAQADYESFRDEANREYAAFVKEAWKQYKVMPAIPKPKDEDRPPVVIKDEERQKPIEDKPLPIENTVTPPAPEPQPVPVAPIREQPKPAEKYVAFTVYGTEMKVRFNDEQRFELTDCSEQAVADGWQRLSGSDYNNTIRDCLELRITRRLSDWAYLNMLTKMAEACVGRGNAATLLTAYIFCQSGYQMRLARAGERLKLLFGTAHTIYGKGYFRIDNVDYYMYDEDEQQLHICNVAFPQEKPLSLLVPQQQDFAVVKSSERMLASDLYHDMKLKVCVNKNLIDFYSNYPSSMVNNNFITRWAMYANTPMETTVKDGLYPALREMLAGKSELGAMERLLNWVQTAFVYEYDDKVWGADRAFFAEESLFYPYCDCEDRSILLSRLVRDLLGLKVILVFYPGHLAMAVHFTGEVKGDYIMLDGKKFVICDPTYINAPVGKTMPNMDNSKATVILLE